MQTIVREAVKQKGLNVQKANSGLKDLRENQQFKYTPLPSENWRFSLVSLNHPLLLVGSLIT